MAKLSLVEKFFEKGEKTNFYWWLSLVVLAIPLLFFYTGERSLMAHDEGYYAIQARWIYETHDWLTPRWWGTAVYDRTIGLQWLVALAYHVFGISELSTRLVSAASGMAGVLLTAAIGAIVHSPGLGWLAGLIFMLSPLWVSESHMLQQNLPVVAIELFGIWCLLKAENSPKRRWWFLAGTSVGLGFLMKGFMVAVPTIALMPYLWLHHRRRFFSDGGIYLGLVGGFIPTAIWLWFSCQKYGGWQPVKDLVEKLLFLSRSGLYDPGPLYYFWNIPVNMFPWPLFAIVGCLSLWQNRRSSENRHYLSLTIVYPAIFFTILSFFKTRMPYYGLQIMPSLAILAAVGLVELPRWQRVGKTIVYLFTGLSALLILLGGTIAFLVRSQAPYDGVERIRFFSQRLTEILPPTAAIYAAPALFLGLGWLTLAASWRQYRDKGMLSWLASWTIGPWFALTLLTMQGAWDDRVPEFKPMLAASGAIPTLQKHIIHVIPHQQPTSPYIPSPTAADPLTGNQHKELVLLTFYTPHLGQSKTQLADLQPGEYAWVLDPPSPYRTIARVGEWSLIVVN
jgi:drug/metabolite transporter superfamily protein YnfA